MPAPLLDRFVPPVDAALARLGADPPPQLVTIIGALESPEAADVSLLSLEGTSPTQFLFGLLAPVEACAVGLAAGGWTLPRSPDRCRARTLVLADRDGNLAGYARVADGPVIDEPATEGLAVDALRRTLGLPTPPPTVPLSELLACEWLDKVVEVSRQSSRRLSWRRAAALHPAVRLLASEGASHDELPLVEVGRAVGNVGDWSSLRTLAMAGRWPCRCYVPPLVAAWMDDGIFARWCRSVHPPLAELVTLASQHLSPSGMRRLRGALRAWGLTQPSSSAA